MNLLPGRGGAAPRGDGREPAAAVVRLARRAAIGIAIVALPLYVTFVASTQTAEEVLQAPMSLMPGRT